MAKRFKNCAEADSWLRNHPMFMDYFARSKFTECLKWEFVQERSKIYCHMDVGPWRSKGHLGAGYAVVDLDIGVDADGFAKALIKIAYNVLCHYGEYTEADLEYNHKIGFARLEAASDPSRRPKNILLMKRSF